MSGRLRAAWADAVVGARFLRDAPRFLRQPPVEASAPAVIQARMARRAADFLAQVTRHAFDRPESLYARLLRLAGCERGDLVGMVEREGLEGALESLYRQGVFLSVEEFKGRAPVVRGSARLEGGPDAVRNLAARFHVPARSSGSRGAGTPILIDLAYVRDTAVDTGAAFQAWGAGGSERATWEVPGGGALYRLLEFAACDGQAGRWFSRLRFDDPELHPRYRRSAGALRWAGRRAGLNFPAPVLATFEDPRPLLDWMVATLRRGRRPLLVAMASGAVRMAQVAVEKGIDLSGAWVVAAGEPTTRGRAAALRAAGLGVIVRYGAIETGALGFACAAPREVDEVHFVADLHALVAAGAEGPLPRGALLLTSLRASAPFALINVSLGDTAVVDARRCGCPLERLGWTTHLHTVRSYEKLTAGGANFLDVDVIRVLEDELPARFGGGVADYQLVEDESAGGRPRLRLRVHPRLGELATDEVARHFLAALGSNSGADLLMTKLWGESGMLEIERAAPATTRTGKTLHVCRISS
jgi:hypothetical protein